MENNPTTTQPKRLLGFAFVVLLAFVGLVIGSMLGGLFFVPEGSGLAGGAMVLGYGVLGLVLAIVGGIILAMRLSRPTLLRATWITLAGVVLIFVGLFIRYQYLQ